MCIFYDIPRLFTISHPLEDTMGLEVGILICVVTNQMASETTNKQTKRKQDLPGESMPQMRRTQFEKYFILFNAFFWSV